MVKNRSHFLCVILSISTLSIRPAQAASSTDTLIKVALGATLVATVKLAWDYFQPAGGASVGVDAHDPTLCDEQSYSFNNLAGTMPQEVTELVDFISQPEKYLKMGARMPRGILLVGPPGTGKTSIARAIAGETCAKFIAISGTEFVEKWVGTGAARVRALFTQARQSVQNNAHKKAIIFLDEIDAIGGSRYPTSGAGSQEYHNTLNELLNQLDGFTKDYSVFIIAATNRLETLDPALTRAGRFDRIVTIGLPDNESREAILRHYISSILHDDAIDYTHLATMTKGMSGADLEALVNEAAICAVRSNAERTTQDHFEQVLKHTHSLTS